MTQYPKIPLEACFGLDLLATIDWNHGPDISSWGSYYSSWWGLSRAILRFRLDFYTIPIISSKQCDKLNWWPSVCIKCHLNYSLGSGMVTTFEIWGESPTFNKWLESSLVRFLAHDFLNSPCQQRAFLADSVPFVDMGCLVVIPGNNRGTRFLSGVQGALVRWKGQNFVTF